MVISVEGEVIERLEMEVQVGPMAAAKLIKQINLSEEEIVEGRPVLMKLNKILAPGLKNGTSFSSSSSSSSRSSLSSRSSSVSSSSSSRISSRAIDAAAPAKRLRSSSRSSSRSVSRSSASSSASSLASLFGASSSSSRSSAHLSRVNIWRLFCDFAWKNINMSAYHRKRGVWQKYFFWTAGDLSPQVPEEPQEAGVFRWGFKQWQCIYSFFMVAFNFNTLLLL